MNSVKIEYCNGFLDAMRLLNSEVTDVYADFFLELLPASSDLHSALGRYFEEYGKNQIIPAREFPAERWHIKINSFTDSFDDALYAICSKWFFISSSMGNAPKDYSYRHNAVVTFFDTLKSALGTFSAYSVVISPPFWYAMEWDNIAFEADDARYLLHFSRSD
jgi:hypothetical protein